MIFSLNHLKGLQNNLSVFGWTADTHHKTEFSELLSNHARVLLAGRFFILIHLSSDNNNTI